MRAYVVDVNVPIVANRRCPQADLNCLLACINALSQIYERGVIVLDDCMQIMSEYLHNLSLAGEPGLGDLFMKWVFENQGVSERCELVKLKPILGDPENFAEFPSDPELFSFDRSDRKYVAVALASRNHPTILNAVDSDWWDHRATLRRNGISLRFLCPQHMG